MMKDRVYQQIIFPLIAIMKANWYELNGLSFLVTAISMSKAVREVIMV